MELWMHFVDQLHSKNMQKRKSIIFSHIFLIESQLYFNKQHLLWGEKSFPLNLPGRNTEIWVFMQLQLWGSPTSAFPVSSIQDIGNCRTGWDPKAQGDFLNSGQARPRGPFSGHFLLYSFTSWKIKQEKAAFSQHLAGWQRRMRTHC